MEDVNDYYYLYLEPGYLARFSKDMNTRKLEVYNNKGEWVLETRPRILQRLNEDSDTISYEEFLEYANKDK